jgi:integrase/recombinase XerC
LAALGAHQLWHFRFQVGNERVQRSTRLASRAAEKVAQREYDAAVGRANGGKPVPTLDQLASEWLVLHGKTASAAHIKSVTTFRHLHIYGLGEKRIADIKTEDVERARNEHLVDRKPATANHWLRVLKLLTMWVVKRCSS